MAYFPAFIKLENQKVLIVGGGKVAQEKLEKLLDFTDDIVLIASEFSSSLLSLIQKHSLKYSCREYRAGDIESFSIVIIAVDSLELQKEIFEESHSLRCLCNAVDSVEYCDFIFPSYIKEDDLTIAISTSGASPAFAKHFKHYLKKLLPSNISTFLQEMKAVRRELPKGKERMELLDKRARKFVESLIHFKKTT